MTPRELSPDTITAKLNLITNLLDVLDGIGDVGLDRIQDDPVLRLALERALTQLVELAASVNIHIAASKGSPKATATYRESFHAAALAGSIPEELAIRLAPSAGMRNLLVHGYADIDWQQVADSIPKFRADYREYVRQIGRWLINETTN